MRILLVEDDVDLSEALCTILKKQKYTVDAVYDGQQGYYMANSEIYDLIILDIMLPKIDGITLLKKLRSEKNNIPILLLTARSSIEDKVNGLDNGADDYLCKPFEVKELLARVRALTRRNYKSLSSDILNIDNIMFYLSSLKISNGTSSFTLTKKENSVFEVLAQNANHIVSKNTIIEKVWGFESEAEDSHVELYISFLRKKLIALNATCEIQTFRGVGYMLKTNGSESIV